MNDNLADKAAIADVVYGYALAIRHRRYAEASALFTADGSFELREGMPGAAETRVRTRLDSPDALLEYLLAGADRPAQPIPMIHNLMVTVDGDTATASSLMEAQVFPSATRTLGEYADSFRREDGTWRFASRCYTIFGDAN
jgi:hypothetical protein